jgi:hypothetical protein
MPITSIQTLINGKEVKEAIDWQNQTIHATFGTDSTQPQVETDRFEYVLDGAKAIIEHVAKGNVFEPLECQQIYSDGTNNFTALDGYFDMSEGYEEVQPTWGDTERPNRVLVKFKQNQSVTDFVDQINGVSFGSLVEEGLISSQDYTTIKTVIVKKANFLDVATLIISTYLVSKQIIDTIKSIQDSIQAIRKDAQDALVFNAQVPPQPSASAASIIASAIFRAAELIIQLAYTVALIALLVKFVITLIELFIPPIVKNQGIKFRTLLEKSCEKFGYKLESNIEELDSYYYLPSKPFTNETNVVKDLIPQNVATEIGIPSTSDYGYLINEFWDLIKSMFNTKIAVVNDTIQLRNADDEYWLKQSTFKPHKSINFPTKQYNTEDLKQTRMMTFATDLNDEWTIENYTGTSYEIKTESTSGTVNNSIKGLERIDIPLCLPNNKNKPNAIEKLMITLAGFADDLASVIGQSSNFRAKIEQNKINVLKVSQNDYGTAKIVPLVSNQLPPNHRNLLSAKVLMEKYHYGKSFVGDALGQKIIYNNFTIPFVLSDLKKTIESGTFTLDDGRVAEFIELNYNFAKDTAECSISVQEVYTEKLKEVTYEP